ncbi:FAD-dependent oxidoreductase [Pelomicrobium sp. G1]|uniref:FAD-dependent oxidoreductase n=1 Tax=unclassified Pelomicrobium TaxID=2815318 RepID=UPI003F76DDE9
MSRCRVVLVGAGHAHLHVALNAQAFRARGAELVLVDPGRLWYSGMATGMLGGQYEPDDDQIDPCPVIEANGGRFVLDRAVGLDRTGREVILASGARLAYDCVSFNVGSEVAADPAWMGLHDVWPVKPILGLVRLRRRLEETFRARPSRLVRVAVIGGGATGGEVTANVDALARRRGGRVQITLVEQGGRLLPGYPAGAGRVLLRALQRRGIEVLFHFRARAVRQGELESEDGHIAKWDVLVVATGLKPAGLVSQLGLPVAEDGGLQVSATLSSVADGRVFAAGDCAALENHRLPKLGVYGVRQGRVLLENLLARAAGGGLRRYRPQAFALSILNLGDGEALTAWGPFYWKGRWCMGWKEWLDRRFVERYRRYAR